MCIAGPREHVHAARECEIARAAHQLIARVADRDERRRARRIDCEARPAQIEQIGDARCEDRAGAAKKFMR